MSTQPTPTRHGQWRVNAAGELIDESQPAPTETATPAEAEAVPESPASTRRKKSTEEQ